MLAGDCDTCHTSGGRTPVFLGSSNGGTGFDPIGCAGCHGRAEDGTGVGTEGYSAGLRQHHFVSGTTMCVNCHSDSDPANKTTVGEDVPPPYYFLPDSSHPSKPTDPCNPAPGLPEDYHGSTLGQDNDGDGVYDEADSDCSTATATPGESSSPSLLPLLVTAHDPIAGTMTLSYDTACAVTDHTLEFGALANVSSYVYDGQECGLGTSGTYVWTYPAGDTFFLIVGNDGSVEGSYGTDAAGVERPEDVGTTCPIPQQLADRCDP